MNMTRLVLIIIVSVFSYGALAQSEGGEVGPAVGDWRSSGVVYAENIPPADEQISRQLKAYQNVRSALLVGWASDSSGLYAVTGFGETPQLYFTQKPNQGQLIRITNLDQPIGEVSVSPASPNFLTYTIDENGDENYQVYLHDRYLKEQLKLSTGPSQKGSIVWSPTGDRLAWYETTTGDRRAIHLASIANPQHTEIIFEEEGAWSVLDWSPDGDDLLLHRFISITQSELYLFELSSKTLRKIDPFGVPASYGDAVFAHRDDEILFTSDAEGEFLSLYRLRSDHERFNNLTPRTRWDVIQIEVSPQTGAYAYTINENGQSRLQVRSKRGDRLTAPILPQGRVVNLMFSPDGKTLAFTIHSALAPAEVYSFSVSRRQNRVDRWVPASVGGLDTEKFIAPDTISYDTFDREGLRRRQVPALVYRPKGQGPFPVVISIHGGPEVQARPVFSALNQFWLNELGIAVIEPNVRGSFGYGKTYLSLDNGMNRDHAVRDIGALLDWIEKDPQLDENNIIVHGGSYGGYMVLASLIKYGDRLAGGINIVGISNFVTFLENTAHYRIARRREEYGDESDPVMRAFLEDISPITQADKITKPILIVQGANDTRVPVKQSEDILNALRENDLMPWYILALEEGHVFRRKTSRDALLESIALFFDEVFENAGEPHALPTSGVATSLDDTDSGN